MSKKNIFNKITTALATSTALSLAFMVDLPKAKAFSLIQEDLFFGRNIAGGQEVSQREFQTFVDSVITPRFPAGLTIFDINGQFRDSTGKLIEEPAKVVTLFREATRFPSGLTIFDANGQFQDSTETIIEEPSKVVSLLLEDALSNETSVNEIVAAYRQQFNQESVLVAVNQDVKVSFGLGDDLIDNSPVPELIQADLFFGRNIPEGQEVSESEFQTFVDSVITPRFPAGLTIFDANGQFQDSTGTIIEEPSKVISIIFEDTLDNETSINQIIGAYLQQFSQESALTVLDEDIRVRFVESEPVPEPSSVTGALLFSTLIIACRSKKKGL
jgi:hypothetical protein